MISKPKDPTSKRPLTVIAGDNKIVSMAINIVLMAICEGFDTTLKKTDSCGKKIKQKAQLTGIFKTSSHGFRPHLGVHTAINTVVT